MHMDLFFAASEKLFFQSLYYSSKSLFSRTYVSNKIESMKTQIPNFTMEISCDPHTIVTIGLKGLDSWNQEIS